MDETGPGKKDYTCPICLDILVEPVTMPCKHSLCMPCYKQTVEKANLCCPICRQRISVWARKASKTNTLVDRRKWEAIKKAYPGKVRIRLEGKEGTDDEDSESDCDDLETQLRKLKELSKPGEIRQEYEAAIEKLQRQREEEAQKEEEASAALIKALQEEEEQELEELEKQREEQERMGRIAAQQFQESAGFDSDINWSADLFNRSKSSSSVRSNVSRASSKTGKKTNKNGKPKRPASTSLTLNTFFSVTPRSQNTALSVTGPGARQGGQGQQSPYPYTCISPQDKIFYGLSPHTVLSQNRSASSSSDEAPGLTEHSYTTASANRIDLTDVRSEQLTVPRKDIKGYDLSKVKSEPEDIFSPGPSGMAGANCKNSDASSDCIIDSYSAGCSGTNSYLVKFQPITGCQRTPPKKLPGGSFHDPPLVKATPRNLKPEMLKVLSSTVHSFFNTSAINSPSFASSSVPQDCVITNFTKDSGKPKTCAKDSENPNSFSFYRQVKGKSLENGKGKGPKSSSSVIHSIPSNAVSEISSLMPENTKAGNTANLRNVERLTSAPELNSESQSPGKSTGSVSKPISTMQVETAKDDGPGQTPSEQSLVMNEKSWTASSSKNAGSQSVHISSEEEIGPIAMCENELQVGDNCSTMQNNGGNEHCSDICENYSQGDNDVEIISDNSEDNTEDVCEIEANPGDANITVNSSASNLTDRVDVVKEKELSILLENFFSSSEEGDGKMMRRGRETDKTVAVSSATNFVTSEPRSGSPLTVSRSENVSSRREELGTVTDLSAAPLTETSVLAKNLCDLENKNSKTKSCTNIAAKGKPATKGKSNGTLDFFIKRQQRPLSARDNKGIGIQKQTKQKTNDSCDAGKYIDENCSEDSISKKRRNSDMDDDVICLGDEDKKGKTQEEIDHLYAVKLQELYSKFDKKNILVDRFKGSKDSYSLRKKRKLK